MTATPVYLASPPEVRGVTGRYFANRRPKKSSEPCYDTAAAARLWQVSARLAGLPATVRHPRTARQAPSQKG
jgi:retinol dehydrogenase 14